MRIATYNINNVDTRFQNLLTWLAETEPDVVCLQELKARTDDFPADGLRRLGYAAAWNGERSWNGVAILARGVDPIVTRRSLPGDPADKQARYIEAAIDGVLIASIYLPNGNPQPGPKFAYKLAWFERLIDHAQSLIRAGAPTVLAGDFNVVPTAQDIYSERSLLGNALIHPESRAAFARLLGQGWTDALRALQPDGPLWTFWSYLRERRAADKGMRLDHLLLFPEHRASPDDRRRGRLDARRGWSQRSRSGLDRPATVTHHGLGSAAIQTLAASGSAGGSLHHGVTVHLDADISRRWLSSFRCPMAAGRRVVALKRVVDAGSSFLRVFDPIGHPEAGGP